MSELLIKPYEAVYLKEIGTYENVPAPPTQEFIVNNRNSPSSAVPEDTSAID